MLAKELENKKGILEKLENPELNRNPISIISDKNLNRKTSFAKGRTSMLGLNKDSKKEGRKVSVFSKMIENAINKQAIEEEAHKKEENTVLQESEAKKNLKRPKTGKKPGLSLNETKSSKVESNPTTKKDASVKKEDTNQKGKKFERSKANI
jgi:hypothetical protein